MNLQGNKTVEELQRQLEAVNARNSQLEQFVQSQLRGDPAVLDQVAQNFQAPFQISSNAVSNSRSSGLSRSKSTITYPTQVKSAITVIHPKALRHLHSLTKPYRNDILAFRHISARGEPFLNNLALPFP